jgi:hypothetical protein
MTDPAPSIAMLAVGSPVVLRIGNRHDREYPSRIEDVADGSVVVTAPRGANSALLASGVREVEISWLTPRGRYEQRCRLDLDAGQARTPRLWRLRPMRPAILVQRRRYIRVRASVDVEVELDGVSVPGETIDVSEGGFRISLPRLEIPDLTKTVVRTVIGRATVALPGYVVRAVEVAPDRTEAVIAFDATPDDAEAVRRLVLRMQLRARASR